MSRIFNRPGVAITCAVFFVLGACDKETRTGDQSVTPPDLPDPVEQTHAPTPPVQPSPDPNPASHVTETELAHFADLEARRASIQQQLEVEAKKGVTEAELTDLRARLQQQLTEVLKESQLDEKRYGEILQLVQRDAALRERVRLMIEAKQKYPRK